MVSIKWAPIAHGNNHSRLRRPQKIAVSRAAFLAKRGDQSRLWYKYTNKKGFVNGLSIVTVRVWTSSFSCAIFTSELLFPERQLSSIRSLLSEAINGADLPESVARATCRSSFLLLRSSAILSPARFYFGSMLFVNQVLSGIAMFSSPVSRSKYLLK